MIDHACDDNGINLVNTEEESYVTCINTINETNDISMNDDQEHIHKYYPPFLFSNNHEVISSGTEYDSEKQRVHCQKNVILYLLLNK